MSPAGRTALVAGGSGLVGGFLVQELLRSDAYAHVVLLNRNPLPIDHPKLVQHTVDFNRLKDLRGIVAGDDVFCTLGTTIRKAGSRSAFRRVDFDYPLDIATIASLQKASQLLIVTSLGADTSSRIFYNRVKGETEAALCKLPFSSIQIFRPSILMGDRPEHRSGERAGIAVMTLLSKLSPSTFERYRPISASIVARAMVRCALAPVNGIRIYESEEIQRF